MSSATDSRLFVDDHGQDYCPEDALRIKAAADHIGDLMFRKAVSARSSVADEEQSREGS